MARKIIFLMIVMGLCWGFTAAGENIDLSIDSVALRLDRQRYVYPQEKIHVTTNQGSYVAGDTIWFRAWVVDAASNTQVAVSRYVYVELISPFGAVDSRVKIKEHNGTYQGYIPIDEDLPEGCYTLSAYTGFMESAGADYFFRKPVDIISP